MRFEGRIVKWDDERGFGFIKADQSDAQVFVHISECPKGQGRPQLGERVSFEVVVDPVKQKKKARKLQFVERAFQRQAHDVQTDRLRKRTSHRSRGAKSRSDGVLGHLIYSLVSLCLLVGAGVWGYDRLKLYLHQQELARQPSTAAPAMLSASSRFRCDGRTHCSQMTSCEEAKFFINNCPGTKMDGDGNGIPCEAQLCRTGW